MSSDFMLDITFYESKPTRFSSFSRNIGRKSKEKVLIHTLQKCKRFMFDVIDPAIRFIICHILYIWKYKVAFSILCYFLFLNKCPGHILENSVEKKLNRVRKIYAKNNFCIFAYVKYDLFWRVSPCHFIEHRSFKRVDMR